MHGQKTHQYYKAVFLL